MDVMIGILIVLALILLGIGVIRYVIVSGKKDKLMQETLDKLNEK